MAAPLETLEDEALVELVRTGDRSAFAVLVHRHSGRVYAIGKSMLRNEQDARDVVQVTFMNAFRKIDSFRGEAAFVSWLKRIATNTALMRLRRRRRKPESPLEVQGRDGEGPRQRDVVDFRPWADKVVEDKELGARIRQAVADLPETYREVLVLADYQKLSMREIADTLELTVPNVKTRLHRARLQVRADLARYLAGRE
jgi:RNA polymerase sigma-70 factor (ECF subfamily)